MADDVKVTVSDNVSGTIERKLRGIGAAAREAHKNVAILQRALKGFSAANAFSQAATQANTFSRAMNNASGNATRLTSNVTRLNTTLGRTHTFARRNQAAFQGFGTSLNRFGGSLGTVNGLLNRMLGYVSIITLAHVFTEASDAATTMRNQLQLVTDSTEELVAAQQRLFDISNRTLTSVDTTTRLYTRLKQALGGAVSSEEELWSITETLNKAVIATGRSTSEATSAILQFTQAMAKGKLDGDEFRSVLENLPILGKALEKQLGVTRGELYELAPAGKITADVIRRAVLSMSKDVDIAFGDVERTIGAALTQLNNKFIEFMNSNSAASKIVIAAIDLIGNNLNIVIPLVTAFAAAWALVQFAAIVQGMYALSTAIIAATSPAVIFTATVVATIGILALLGETIARLTGRYEEWNAWLDDATTAIADTVAGITGMIAKAAGVEQLTTNTKRYAGSANDAAKSTGDLSGQLLILNEDGTRSFNGIASGATTAATAIEAVAPAAHTAGDAIVQTVKGGVQGFQSVKKAVDATTASLNSMTVAAQKAFTAAQKASAATKYKEGSSAGEGKSAGSQPAFNRGGSFEVGGRAGVDRNQVAFRASRGERVDILTRRQQRQQARSVAPSSRPPMVINMTVVTDSPDDFRRSRRQIAGDLSMAMGG